MIIRQVDIWHLQLTFLSPIKHSLATHQGTNNLVVKVSTDGPLPGYGEGVPRDFVTGETLAGSLAFLTETLAPAILGQEFSSPSTSCERAVSKQGREKYPGALDVPQRFSGTRGTGRLIYMP
jgi:hypothetical protein